MKKKPIIDIQTIIEQRRKQGLLLKDARVHIKIADAKEKLMYALVDHLGERAKWLSEYDKVADWLTDNEGVGLILLGSPGMGKTVLIHHVIPQLLLQECNKVVSLCDALSLNRDIDHQTKVIDVMRERKLVAIDDIGTEPIAQKYGESHNYFSELVDKCERDAKLLLCSSNLSLSEIKERYGLRTYDRLRTLTKVIAFKGESMRK